MSTEKGKFYLNRLNANIAKLKVFSSIKWQKSSDPILNTTAVFCWMHCECDMDIQEKVLHLILQGRKGTTVCC